MKKFFKQIVGYIAIVAIIGFTFAAFQPWEKSTFELIQKAMRFTSNGRATGTLVMDINTGGKIIAYGPLLDGSGNSFITDASLSGYITGGYLSGYLTGTKASINYRALSGTDIYYTTGDLYTKGVMSKGRTNTNNGIQSTVIGTFSDANASYAVAIGNSSKSSGDSSVAIATSKTYGKYSVAIGKNSETYNGTSNNGAMAFGNSVIASGDMNMAIGKYNKVFETYPFIIGIGTGSLYRKNALIVNNSGNIGIGDDYPTERLTVAGNINVTNGFNIYDGNGNKYITGVDLSGYITGFNELDPIWNLEKSNYLTGFLELDPLWMSASGNYATLSYLSNNYYDTTGIDNKLAAFAGGLIYKGTRDMSTGAFPIGMNTGDFYKISVSGTGGGEYYAVEDMMVGNKKKTGATNSGDWDRIVNTSNPEIDPIWQSEKASYLTTGVINTLSNTNLPMWSGTKFFNTPMQYSESGNLVNTNSNVSMPSTGVIKIGSWNNYTTAFNMSLGFDVNTSLIGGLDFKNTNAGGQIRFMARNDQDSYLIFSVAGSSNVASFFGVQGKDTSTILSHGLAADPDKKLSIGTFNAGDLLFGTNNIERIRILSNGRVGIGTNSPTNSLSVSGNINVTDGYNIYDGAGNKYITGFTESDPMWMSQSGSYATKEYVDSNTGRIESDPIWMAQSGNYLRNYNVLSGISYVGNSSYLAVDTLSPIVLGQEFGFNSGQIYSTDIFFKNNTVPSTEVSTGYLYYKIYNNTGKSIEYCSTSVYFVSTGSNASSPSVGYYEGCSLSSGDYYLEMTVSTGMNLQDINSEYARHNIIPDYYTGYNSLIGNTYSDDTLTFNIQKRNDITYTAGTGVDGRMCIWSGTSQMKYADNISYSSGGRLNTKWIYTSITGTDSYNNQSAGIISMATCGIGQACVGLAGIAVGPNDKAAEFSKGVGYVPDPNYSPAPVALISKVGNINFSNQIHTGTLLTLQDRTNLGIAPFTYNMFDIIFSGNTLLSFNNNGILKVSSGISIGIENPTQALDISGSFQMINGRFYHGSGDDKIRQGFSGHNYVTEFLSGSNWIPATETTRPR